MTEHPGPPRYVAEAGQGRSKGSWQKTTTMTPPNETDSDEAEIDDDDDIIGICTSNDASTPGPTDTPDSELRERIRDAAASEPLAPEIGFRAITLQRVILEADNGEQSIADWIRDAVDMRLGYRQHDEFIDIDTLPGSRPKRDNPVNESMDFELVELPSTAHPGDWFSTRVEFPAGILKVVVEKCDDGQTVANWVRSAVVLRFSLIDSKIELKPGVEIEVPDEILARARFKAKRKVILRGGDYDHELRDALHKLVNPQAIYTRDGEEIVRVDGDE